MRGNGPNPPNPGEKTILGIAPPANREKTIVGVAPPANREKTIQGVAVDPNRVPGPPRDPSIEIPVVEGSILVEAPARAVPAPRVQVRRDEEEDDDDIEPAGVPRKGGVFGKLFLLLLIACAAAAYVERDRLPEWIARARELVDGASKKP